MGPRLFKPEVLPCARNGDTQAGARHVRCNNRDARGYVRNLEPFANSQRSLFGYWVTADVYAVFSYHTGWPLFVWSGYEHVWLENSDRISTTTSHHRNAAHPGLRSTPRSRESLCRFLETLTQETRHAA